LFKDFLKPKMAHSEEKAIKDETKNGYDRFELINYFNLNNSDASLVSWSHGVNNAEILKETLKSDLMFIEADIIHSKIKNEAVMGHPPQTDSHLTFSKFLEISLKSSKGLKLDFKDPKTVYPCLQELKTIYEKFNLKNPIMLNADIFEATHSMNHKSKFEFNQFLMTCMNNFPNGAISVGWPTTNSTTASYTWQDVYTAFNLYENLLNRKKIKHITYPVRALWTVKSIFRLKWLTLFTDATLTVWTNENDILSSLESLLLIRKYFKKSDVFFDLPPSQYQILIDASTHPKRIDEILNSSKDNLVKETLKDGGNNFLPELWQINDGVV
jgi:hypothetical protein